jgi:hypothetical protein
MARYYVLLSEVARKARKTYVCCHCAEPIVKNEKYIFTSIAIAGTVQADRWHEDCRGAVERWEEKNWPGWTPGKYRRGTVRRRWG